MDIEILLVLQNFRNGAGAFLSDFISKVTFFGELNTAIVLLAIVYWSISKNFGTYLLMGWTGNRIVNGFLKVTACAYRPWIRDSRIVPEANALKSATGYSFPSGHTMSASAIYGGGLFRKDIPLLLKVFLGLIVVLIAFSRIFLGVHTPQDVLVGTISGLIVMWLISKLFNYLEENPNKITMVVVIGSVIAILVALYASFKSYPVDYDSEGKILVDGAKMANDTFKAVGWTIAFLVGWLLERRYVKFSTDVKTINRVTRIITGSFGYYVVSLILLPLIKNLIAGPIGTVLTSFIQMFYISFVFPYLIKRFEK